MSDRLKVAFLLLLMFAVAAWATFYFRVEYTHARRLRTVDPGRFYRCGQPTEAGFRDIVRGLGIRTVVNVQDDIPDPNVWHNYVDRHTVKESALCKELNVRYVWLTPDLLPAHAVELHRPLAIDQFLELMDQESSYPVLLHCKAGLHRTGVLSAVYHMEYQGWSRQAAYRELRAHGFGDWVSTTSNPYIDQYVFRYRPREPAGRARAAAGAAGRLGLVQPRAD